MAKIIKFPLLMADGTQARTLDDLKEHFDIASVLRYYFDGKFQKWLEDRYYEEEAAALKALDSGAPDFPVKLGAVFGVTVAGDETDVEAVKAKNLRVAKLREYTDDKEMLDKVDSFAFNNAELISLLDKHVSPIYLCGEIFPIPLSYKNVTYIGVNNPTVKPVISGETYITFEELGIAFKGVTFDESCPEWLFDSTPKQITGIVASYDHKISDSFFMGNEISESDYKEITDKFGLDAKKDKIIGFVHNRNDSVVVFSTTSVIIKFVDGFLNAQYKDISKVAIWGSLGIEISLKNSQTRNICCYRIDRYFLCDCLNEIRTLFA
ncbi:hypothetical protein AGMMS49957_06250 [Synergistales bacterium]|nr:hypothetical protein AGMMS49957_06250 [Synergistales bacterium]